MNTFWIGFLFGKRLLIGNGFTIWEAGKAFVVVNNLEVLDRLGNG
mgnify:FL=1